MSLIQSIKQDQLAARKASKTRLASILTTLIGEAEMKVFDDGKRETTDTEVITVLKKFHVNAVANAQLFNHRNIQSQATRQGYLEEVAVYESYMPKQMTEAEITNVIERHFITTTQGLKGIVMRYFKENYAGQYDGKVVSSVVDNLIGK